MDIELLEAEVNKNNCAFLCGNGFSINFDDGFRFIHERLYYTHKQLYRNTNYIIKSNAAFIKKLKDNYSAVLKKIKYIKENDFYKIFDDGIKFASSIIQTEGIIDELEEAKLIRHLVYDLSQLTGLYSIHEIGNSKGASFINVEYWPILIHFYFALKKINSPNYNFPTDNFFIDLAEIGYSSNVQLNIEEEIEHYTLFNGLNTYYKMLYSLAIFNNGKVLDINKLDKLDSINLGNIRKFLSGFNLIFTLNYDHIIENLIDRPVIHLHGQYSRCSEEYVYNQSFNINTAEGNISCSNILLGDFFINKTMFSIISGLAVDPRSPNNKKIISIPDSINRAVSENNINEFLIFGMNINNDQHILRDIMIALFDAKSQNPKIIYSYFNEEEKDEFHRQFYDVIKFGKELSDYARRIEVEYIKTKEILESYFIK